MIKSITTPELTHLPYKLFLKTFFLNNYNFYTFFYNSPTYHTDRQLVLGDDLYYYFVTKVIPSVVARTEVQVRVPPFLNFISYFSTFVDWKQTPEE